MGANVTDITLWRIWELIGRGLNWLKLPAAVRETSIMDSVSGQTITIHSGVLYTRISVNGRDYYFDRITGKFGGTGSGCS